MTAAHLVAWSVESTVGGMGARMVESTVAVLAGKMVG